MNLSLGCVLLENGRCPFLDGLEELPVTDHAKVLAWAKRLAAHDELRRPPYAKHLDAGIFELRLSLRAVVVRVAHDLFGGVSGVVDQDFLRGDQHVYGVAVGLDIEGAVDRKSTRL